MRPREKGLLCSFHAGEVCMMSSMDQAKTHELPNITTLIYYFHQFFSWKENNLTIPPISEMNWIIGLQKNKTWTTQFRSKFFKVCSTEADGNACTPIYKKAYNIAMCRMTKVKYIKNFIQGTMREISFIYQSTRRKNNIIQNKGGKVQLNLSIL
jgi:hypothetical protein